MYNKFCSILVVDTDQAGALSVAKALKAHGHSVLTARDGAHAVSILEFRAFEVLVVDVTAGPKDNMDVIGWATCACPRPRIVAVGTDSVGPDVEKAILRKGAGLFLRKPVDVDKLLQFLAPTLRRSSFTGSVEDVDIVEYLQFVLLGGRKTILEITSSLGTQGSIYIGEGMVHHAVCGVLRGEQAFYRCLCFKQGTFAHLPWQEPEAKTINKPGEFLLMEAVRKRDEAWGDDGALQGP